MSHPKKDISPAHPAPLIGANKDASAAPTVQHEEDCPALYGKHCQCHATPLAAPPGIEIRPPVLEKKTGPVEVPPLITMVLRARAASLRKPGSLPCCSNFCGPGA